MISIIIPTRNRPDSLKKVTESAFALAKHLDQIEFVFYVDYDDQVTIDAIPSLQTENIRFFIGPKVFLSVAWNILATQHARYPIISPLGDDAIFRTQDWDDIIISEFEKYPDKIALVYAKDGLQNEKMATQAFLHQNWIKTVGYCLPPYFFTDFTDVWLTEVAKDIKRKVYLPHVYIEHIHPAAGKGTLDQTHIERMARIQKGGHKLYKKLDFLRDEDAQKLKTFIKNFN